ncbi:hypothetical protein [Ramlibacter albus]|uniref:Uncharacterized protein n=1 Tax=Ramlibacter albus TaxID=2079448 RepID=A0A923MD11_9BURK|nr:hypothetical protein [Ramlibacter albus]MBC5767291.1 hypothetical protein [Ramlibacter albus]
MTVAASSTRLLALHDRSALVAAPEPMALAALADWALAAIDEWKQRRRLAAARREFARLGPAALRDLAMSGCEFESYWAEANGQAQRTRRRVG